jgi:hypothetical protein
LRYSSCALRKQMRASGSPLPLERRLQSRLNCRRPTLRLGILPSSAATTRTRRPSTPRFLRPRDCHVASAPSSSPAGAMPICVRAATPKRPQISNKRSHSIRAMRMRATPSSSCKTALPRRPRPLRPPMPDTAGGCWPACRAATGSSPPRRSPTTSGTSGRRWVFLCSLPARTREGTG